MRDNHPLGIESPWSCTKLNPNSGFYFAGRECPCHLKSSRDEKPKNFYIHAMTFKDLGGHITHRGAVE